jgi:hypothetical protein
MLILPSACQSTILGTAQKLCGIAVKAVPLSYWLQVLSIDVSYGESLARNFFSGGEAEQRSRRARNQAADKYH